MKVCSLFFLFAFLFSYGQKSDFGDINFKKADSIALTYKGESLNNLPVLTHKLTSNLTTDVEKFRAIYTWVCTNIENDYEAYLKTKKKRKKLSKDRGSFILWNNSFTPKVFERLLSQKKTACTGYAYLIKELASLVDLDCKIIDGYGRTATLDLNENSLPNHSWNAIALNNKWYLCDVTWSAGRILIEEGEPEFRHEYYDGYFLADPALFIKNHYPIKSEWALLEEPPTFKQFLEGPIVYKDAFQHNIDPITPNKMRIEIVKNESVPFTFSISNNSIPKNINLLVNHSSSGNQVQALATKDEKEYVLEHVFKKSGLYDAHIQVNDSIIATYVVKVKRK